MGRASVTFRSGRKKPWLVRWREHVGSALEERAKSFSDGLVAGAFRIAHENEDEDHGELAMSHSDRARWWRIKADCVAGGVEPEAAIVAGLAALRSSAGANEQAGTALGLWGIDARARKLRSASIGNVNFAVREFIRGREERRVREFSPAEIMAWVAARYVDQSSRDTMLGRLLTFFRWCASRPRRWCDGERLGEARWDQRVLGDEHPTRFYSAAEMRAYLDAAPDRLKAALATGFLLGLRPFELCRLQAVAIIDGEKFGFDEKKGQWRLPGEWTKTRKFRLLHALPDAWWYWWMAYSGAARPRDRRAKRYVGRVVCMSYRRLLTCLTDVRERTGLRQIDDGFRHSFATHGYHRSADGRERGVEWCLAMVGHRGRLTVFAKHYDGKVDALEAEDYFLSYPAGAACDVRTRARVMIT